MKIQDPILPFSPISYSNHVVRHVSETTPTRIMYENRKEEDNPYLYAHTNNCYTYKTVLFIIF